MRQRAAALGADLAAHGRWSASCSALPLAWLLARVDFPGRGLLRAPVAVPLVLPPVVAGVALVTALGRNGLVGALLRESHRR